MSVCLFVCLFGSGAQTTGRIPTKFGMGYPLVSVGNLKLLFWVDLPQGGYDFEKTQKSKLSPYGRGWRAESFCGTFGAFFFFYLDTIFIGPWGARPSNGCEADRNQLVNIYKCKIGSTGNTVKLLWYKQLFIPYNCLYRHACFG